MRRLFLLPLAALFLAAAAASAGAAQTYALLIGGLGGPPPYQAWYDDWTQRFENYLTKDAGVPVANITRLTGAAASEDAIVAALGKFAKEVNPEDQFILFLAGHGESTGSAPTLILQGVDLSISDLATALNGIRSKDQVILNFSASSGDSLRFLTSPSCVNISAHSPSEGGDSVFAEFFLRGLESKRAASNAGSPVNMLDAYNWATVQNSLWIARWAVIPPPAPPEGAASPAPTPTGPSVWTARGKETIEIFEKLYGKDPSRKLDASAGRNAQDALVGLAPSNGVVDDAWANKRIVSEHAMIEDCGETIGVAAVGEKGIQPVLGKNPKDPGYFASKTVLGQPGVSPNLSEPAETTGTTAAAPAASPTATPEASPASKP